MCTKNGNYCENEKKRKSPGEGGCVQRMEVIVKRKKPGGGGGQGRCERRSEGFYENYYYFFFFFFFFFLGGGGGGGWRCQVEGGVRLRGGGVRVDVNKEVKLL